MCLHVGEQCHVAVNGDEQTVMCEWAKTDTDANHSQKTTDNERKFSSVPITDTEVRVIRLVRTCYSDRWYFVVYNTNSYIN